jgi:hypothetical protein
MSFEVGNREKIAVLVIACLVTIGMIHYFFFLSKTFQYRRAYSKYQTEVRQPRVASHQQPQIDKFITDTDDMGNFIDLLARDMNIDYDPVYFEQGEEAIERMQARLLEQVTEVTQLRQKYAAQLRLPFLDWTDRRPTAADPRTGEGWDVPSRLPSNLRRSEIWDAVENLNDSKLALDVLQNPAERMAERVRTYNPLLQSLGIDPNRLRDVAQHGGLVPLIKRVAHANLLWAQKQQDEQAGDIRIPVDSKDDLFNLLEVELPEDMDALRNAIKQLEFLLRLIDLAAKSSIEEVRKVNLHPVRKIDQIITEDQRLRLVPEIHFDQNIPQAGARRPGRRRTYVPEDDGSMYAPDTPGVRPRVPRQVDPRFQTGRRTGITDEPVDPLKPTPTPEPIPRRGGDWIGDAVPITIQFLASWENTLNYLYVISHNRNPFDIDSLALGSFEGSGGNVIGEATVVPMTLVKGLEALYAPVTTSTLTAGPGVGPGPAGATVSRPGPVGPGGGIRRGIR